MKTYILILSLLTLSACATNTDVQTETELPGQQLFLDADARVDTLLSKMTLEEKVGQMTQVDQDFLATKSDISDYLMGSLLSGGGSDPVTNSLQDWRAMYEDYQSEAMKTRLQIPLLYGVDAVHGHSNVIGAVIFPHNIGLGATRNADLVEEISRITAKEVRATGINWTFAPCVAVPRDDRWGRTYEGFAEEPMLVAKLGLAAVKGLQGVDLTDPLRVLACAKHFIGDGGTVYGTGMYAEDGSRYPLDRGDVPMSEEEIRRVHMEGYVTAVNAGVGTIMPSYSSWNGVLSSGSYRLLTEILKEEMGFEGFLISDYAAIDALPGDYKSDVQISINAGMDMVMVPERYELFFNTLKELAEEGGIPMERIDDAVRRILRVKFAMGLFEKDYTFAADRSLEDSFGSDEHRAVGRQSVRESMVVLKNEEATLPLSKSVSHIHVTGPGADDIGMQSGGWTIEWQGELGDVTEGTTVLEAIQASVSAETMVTYSADGTGGEDADVIVLVVGEKPYAEFFGDDSNLVLDAPNQAAFNNAAASGKPMVTLLFSGRPMIVNDVMDASQAFIAAWLPGSEGDGMTDVLFGDYAPTGKLSFTWPRTAAQNPINVGDENYDPLFPFGFGLTF